MGEKIDLTFRARDILTVMIQEWGEHLSFRNAIGKKVATHDRFYWVHRRFIKCKKASRGVLAGQYEIDPETSDVVSRMVSSTVIATFDTVLETVKSLMVKIPEMGHSSAFVLQQFANRWNTNERWLKYCIHKVERAKCSAYEEFKIIRELPSQNCEHPVGIFLQNFCSRVLCILQQLMRALKNKHRLCTRLLAQAKLAYDELVERDDFSELSKIVPAMVGYKRGIFSGITIKEAESV